MNKCNYSLEDLDGFLDSVFDNNLPTKQQLVAAFWALHEAIYDGADLRKRLGIKPKRGQRGKKYDPDKMILHYPQVPQIVLDRATGRIKTNNEAYVKIAEQLGTTDRDLDTPKRIFHALLPKVQDAADVLRQMDQLRQRTKTKKPAN